VAVSGGYASTPCFLSGTEQVKGKAPNQTTTWTLTVLLPHNGGLKGSF